MTSGQDAGRGRASTRRCGSSCAPTTPSSSLRLRGDGRARTRGCTRPASSPPRSSTRSRPSSPRSPHDGASRPGGRGRPHGDRATARRRRPQDPRRPLAQRPGCGGAPPLRRSTRARRRARRSTRSRSSCSPSPRPRPTRSMPGYTHLQRAQPVTLGHHLLAWVEMLDRDRDALRRRGRGRRAESPLGAGALAGSTLDLPAAAEPDAELDRRGRRPRLRARLPLRGRRPLHRTSPGSARRSCSGRPPSSASSRLPETAATGSSMMPQKLNPDVAELVRGKAGHGDRPADRPARDA